MRSVDAACDEFQHTHLLRDVSRDDALLFGLVFSARIGDATLEGVDLLELNDDGLISRFTVVARPLSALMALGARMREQSASTGGLL